MLSTDGIQPKREHSPPRIDVLPGAIHLGGTINNGRCSHLGLKRGVRENQAEAYALKLGEKIKKRELPIENALYPWITAQKRA